MKRAAFVLGVLLIAGCSGKQEPAVSSLPVVKSAPSFSFVNYDSRTITQNDLAGNIYIVEFFFTSCGGPCPVMNSTANVLQAEFADIPNFRIVAFTVDPDTDTLERLAKYAARYGARPDRWYFLRNVIDSVASVASRGFMMGSVSEPTLHSTRFALVDQLGMIRGYYDALDPAGVDELRAAIRYLARENG